MQDDALARRENAHELLEHRALFGACESVLVGAQGVAERGVIVVLAAWGVQRGRSVGAEGLQGLDDVFLVGAHVGGDLGDGRLAAEREREFGPRPLDPHGKFPEVARDTYGPGTVAVVALDLAGDGGDRVAGERNVACEVEAVDGLDQCQAGDLEQIVEGLGRSLVAACQVSGQGQEALDDHLPVDRVAVVQVALEEGPILAGARVCGIGSPRRAGQLRLYDGLLVRVFRDSGAAHAGMNGSCSSTPAISKTRWTARGPGRIVKLISSRSYSASQTRINRRALESTNVSRRRSRTTWRTPPRWHASRRWSISSIAARSASPNRATRTLCRSSWTSR